MTSAPISKPLGSPTNLNRPPKDIPSGQRIRTAQAVAQHHNAAPVTLPSAPWEKEKNDE